MKKTAKQKDKNMRKSSPQVLPKRKIGSVNPESLSLPILQKKNLYPTFNELAKLSFKAETLKNETDHLEQSFYDMLNEEENNKFCKYKKWQLDFQQRLAQRQQELQAFSRMLPTFRTTANPNNSDLIAMKPKRFDSDNLTYTLLVNNNYRKFFSLPDINSQNDELKKLIEEQKQELSILNARLNLFRQCYQRDYPKMTVTALMNKTIPSPASTRSPDRNMEFNVEKKVLQEQLQEVIQQRKSILNARTQQKLKKREERKKQQSATKIQKVWRGYRSRQELKAQKASATKIQKVWRGYKVRNPEKVAEAKKIYETTKNPFYFLEAFHKSLPQEPSQSTYSKASPRVSSIKQRAPTPEENDQKQTYQENVEESQDNQKVTIIQEGETENDEQTTNNQNEENAQEDIEDNNGNEELSQQESVVQESQNEGSSTTETNQNQEDPQQEQAVEELQDSNDNANTGEDAPETEANNNETVETEENQQSNEALQQEPNIDETNNIENQDNNLNEESNQSTANETE